MLEAIGRLRTALTAALVLLIPLAGCVYSRTREVTVSRFRRPVKKALLAAAVEGQTTRRQLLERLGPPTAIREGEGGTEVLVYDFLKRTDEETSALVLYKRTRRKTEILRFLYELRDGVVVRVRHRKVHAG